MNFEEPELSERSILLAYRGSIAHGMHLPPEQNNGFDDIDLISVYVPSIQSILGLSDYGADKGALEVKLGPYDAVAYDIRKMIKMLAQANPNVLSLLWTKRDHIINSNAYGELLISKRDMFLTKRVFGSFVGYASNQLHRMTSAQAYQGYMGEKRRALVDQFGYDTKNAAHSVRLLRMACEALEGQGLIVDRTGLDANELIDIKRGVWDLGDVKRITDGLFHRAQTAFESTKLPEACSAQDADDLCIHIISEYYGIQLP